VPPPPTPRCGNGGFRLGWCFATGSFGAALRHSGAPATDHGHIALRLVTHRRLTHNEGHCNERPISNPWGPSKDGSVSEPSEYLGVNVKRYVGF
jgi:hypothetical protein